ncbi:outer membrane lipoprotein carrier protein [Luteimonas cucumeris]|uniref:Outer-membrane lipoprotein carrier protein n=1 Tax=Luteimonas cucumeris TaxID=985012 RepID=A0A562L872_9GAMM|nr:outer membrane lipoprotein chaperone LolA [Luteimonas cucumeris]TWI03821.1 outer membrane lipoprotein carrier protein [Luteimonas cucumeris]
MKRVAFIAAMAASVFSLCAMATAREDLTAFTRGLKGLDGQFTQRVYDNNGQLKESTSGRVALSAPRLFRWEYLKPHPQLIVADGKKVWVYDPDLQQVAVRAQGVEEQDSPLVALIDPRKLEQDFRVAEAGTDGGLDWLLLTPRNEDQASFQSARLGFGPAGLVQMKVVDGLGQRTEIVFSDWKRNPDFARGTFTYTPPKGVDVIGTN